MFKGHGTGNDFVIVPDVDGTLALSDGQIRLLCDRHRGIGADGVLRAVRVALDPEARALAERHDGADGGGDSPEWFMDYRNADGSRAQMCGNGARVFAQYLAESGLAGTDGAGFPLLTRGGIVRVRRAESTAADPPAATEVPGSGAGRAGLVGRQGSWTVEMGRARLLTAAPSVGIGPRRWAALAAVEMPNPHVVVRLADASAIASLDLSQPPDVVPPLPAGQNVEFVAQTGPRRLVMRVHERGVGETMSCGTGICAAAVAMAADAAAEQAAGPVPEEDPWLVDVPGGTCAVALRADGSVELTGPAVLVAELTVDARWLDAPWFGAA